MRHGSLMQNIVINMCENIHYDRLRNDRALGNRKFDHNKKHKNNVRSVWRIVSLGVTGSGIKTDCLNKVHRMLSVS